jgi:hypothetical protein
MGPAETRVLVLFWPSAAARSACLRYGPEQNVLFSSINLQKEVYTNPGSNARKLSSPTNNYWSGSFPHW